jgi:hypothetical protein
MYKTSEKFVIGSLQNNYNIWSLIWLLQGGSMKAIGAWGLDYCGMEGP